MQFIFDTGEQRMDPGWFRRSEENNFIRDYTASPDDISGGNRNLHLTYVYANTAFNEVNLFFYMARHNQYPLLCRCLTGRSGDHRGNCMASEIYTNVYSWGFFYKDGLTLIQI